jgi:hypothetical protein
VLSASAVVAGFALGNGDSAAPDAENGTDQL